MHLRRIPLRLLGAEHLPGWLPNDPLLISRVNYLIAVKFTSAVIKAAYNREKQRLEASVDVGSVPIADSIKKEANGMSSLDVLFARAYRQAVLDLGSSNFGQRIFKSADLAVLRIMAGVQNRVTSLPKPLRPSQVHP